MLISIKKCGAKASHNQPATNNRVFATINKAFL